MQDIAILKNLDNKKNNFENGQNHLAEVTSLFDKIIAPIYGDQQKMINRIKNGVKICRLLFNEGKIAGVLVLDSQTTSIHSEKNLYLKTLFVVDSKENSGKGYGTKLLIEAIKFAKSKNATSLAVTVSESKPESLEFFKKKGFKIIESQLGRYSKGVVEHTLLLKL